MSYCIAISTNNAQSVVRWEVEGDDLYQLVVMAMKGIVATGYEESSVVDVFNQVVEEHGHNDK